LLIIAGDVCPDLRPIEEQGRWLGEKFVPWLREQPATRIVGTWGNHDFAPMWKKHIPEELFGELATFGVDELVEVEGLKIWLTPWVPNLSRWAFAFAEDVPAPIRKEIPEGLDILVSHGPPFGYFDEAQRPDGLIIGNSDPWGSHVGSKSLRNRCLEAKPKVVVCGHIHEGRGFSTTVWDGKIYNVSSLDRRYEPYDPRFMEVEI